MPKVYPDLKTLYADLDKTIALPGEDETDTRNFQSTVVNRSSLKRKVQARNKALGFNGSDDEATRECWKDDAWFAYDNLEAVSIAIDTVAKGVAAGKLVVGLEQENGSFKPTEVELPNRVLRQFRGPEGCHYSHFLEHAATNLQVTGDGYFVAHRVDVNPSTNTRGDDGADEKIRYVEWEYVSDQELTVVSTKDGGKKIFRDPYGSHGKAGNFLSRDNSFKLATSTRKQLSDDQWYIKRGHRENKRFTGLSDSALKKNLGVLREIFKLTNHIHSVVDSKMPAGILLIPEELTFGQSDILLSPGDPENGEPAEYLDQLDVEVIEHFAEPIDDHSSTEIHVPLLIRGAAKYLEEVRYLDVSKNLDIVSHRIRDELFDRLFNGLDVPREMIEGKGSLNHWTGKNIDGDLTSNHVIPLGELIARLITKHYLRPMLIQCGMSAEEAEKYMVMFDASSILPRADQSTIAMKLYELEVISEKALLEYSGFEPTDAPDANERLQRTIFKLILSSPVTLAPLLLPLVDGLEGVAEELQLLKEAQEGDGPFRNKRSSEPAGDDGRGRGLKSLLPSTKSDNAPRERSADLPPSEERRQDSDQAPEETGRQRLSDNTISTIANWLAVHDFSDTPLEGMSDEEASVVVAELLADEVGPDSRNPELPNDLIEEMALVAAIVRSQVLAIATQRAQAKVKRFEIEHLDADDDQILTQMKDLEFDLMETSITELTTSSPMDRLSEHVMDQLGEWMTIHNQDSSAPNTAPTLAGLIMSDFRAYVEGTYSVADMSDEQALEAPRTIIAQNIERYLQEGASLAPVPR